MLEDVDTFKVLSVFAVDYDSSLNLPNSFDVRYGRHEQRRGDKSNNVEVKTDVTDDDSNDVEEDVWGLQHVLTSWIAFYARVSQVIHRMLFCWGFIAVLP